MIGRPLIFDFSGSPPDPEWIVDGLLERGTLTVLAGAPGTAKSFLEASMVVSVVQGKPWIGRPTVRGKALYIDEENHSREIHTRMHGLGMTNEDRAKLRYYCRQGIRIGEDETVAELHKEIDTWEPDLMVVDTASSALALESVNDNSQVSAIMRTLRGFCSDRTAVVLLHHENKAHDKEKRSARTAIMGAQQWQGQADQHLALSTKMEEPEERKVGANTRRRFVLKLEAPKNRGGRPLAQNVELVSEHGPDEKPIPGKTVVRPAKSR